MLSEIVTELANERLCIQVEAEYDAFIQKLGTLPNKEVIELSYEKVMKEELLAIIKNETFPFGEAKLLSSSETPLDDLYKAWLATDVSYVDMLRDSINDYVGKILFAKKSHKETAK